MSGRPDVPGMRDIRSGGGPLAAHLGPYFGDFGGRFVPEALIAALDEIERVTDRRGWRRWLSS